MRAALRTILFLTLAIAVLVAGYVGWVGGGIGGERFARGAVTDAPIPEDALDDRHVRGGQALQAAAGSEVGTPSQILFGDLHVHTTYSSDAFIFALPLLQGEGSHPPADACDFARFCAELDFWSINDHAEHLTPWQWEETKASIRECNAVAGDPAAPDLVAFLGWEWTQSAPALLGGDRVHYGHKNVILRETADERVPARPIGAGSGGVFPTDMLGPVGWAALRSALSLGDFPGNLGPYIDLGRFTRDIAALPECAPDVPVRDLPRACLEGAPTPADLFRKLDEWDTPSLVIPHGTSWGIHAPPAADLADQIVPSQHDQTRQTLFEVYSGHGASELWRNLIDVEVSADGSPTCAAPRDGYEPCCWRAGEIIRNRCGDADAEICERRVADARQWFLDAGGGDRARGVVPGARPDDWGECGQLAGAFLPALDYRSRMSAQYGLARRPAATEGAAASAFRVGLIGSSDNHKARAGAGYKEIERKAFGDAYGLRSDWQARLAGTPVEPAAAPVPVASLPAAAFADPGSDRNASYYYTAGLVAVHAESRDREAIFGALEARRAYGTSGPRILLHFDLENATSGPAPMGAEARVAAPPRFRVAAVGAFEQKPGCPSHTRERLSPERIASLCRGECYHPGDRRIPIARIEVVRIRPQARPDEPLEALIEDPWRTIECDDRGEGCSATFTDEHYDPAREHVYYVRALQVPTPAVNGDPMRCERDAEGRCVRARSCPASGPDFDPDDDCLSPVNERAWSSPIFVLPSEG